MGNIGAAFEAIDSVVMRRRKIAWRYVKNMAVEANPTCILRQALSWIDCWGYTDPMGV